jgi:hypothetical protein
MTERVNELFEEREFIKRWTENLRFLQNSSLIKLDETYYCQSSPRYSISQIIIEKSDIEEVKKYFVKKKWDEIIKRLIAID